MRIKRSMCSCSGRFEKRSSLPRACTDDHLVTLALKQDLSDRGYVDKQVIRPGLVNRVLAKPIEVNPLYQNIQIDPSWENVSQESGIMEYTC